MAAVLCVAACTSSSGTLTPTPSPATQTVRLGDVGLSVNLTPERRTAVSGTLDAPSDRVWAALPGVLDSLGVVVTNTDSRTLTIGNGGFKARRKLKGVALTRYLDCGSTQLGPSAETYELLISVTTQLRGDGSARTHVSTVVEASARPITFSGQPVSCRSKHALEAQIFTLLRSRLQS